MRILKRDIVRLLKSPAALVVVIALLVLPSVYTWYNVVAFWDPYVNTGNLKVCVVNQDAGASSDATGDLNVGERIVEELRSNDQLDWTEEDYDAALEDLKAGRLYAVYVIPQDFSECLISPLSGEVKHPKLEYYANEKISPVSPKITDAAANALDQTINSMFVTTVSDMAVKVVDEAIEDAKTDIADSKSKASKRFDDARKAISQVQDALSDLEATTKEAKDKVSTVSEAVGNAAPVIDDAALEELERRLEERMAHLSDTFPQYLLYLIRQKGLENSDVYKRAIVDKKVFSKIKNNPDYHPQKRTALCLCIGALLSLDEAKDLLARAGYALSPCDKTDIIFAYFIEHGIYDMIELDIQLEEHGLPCLIS